MMNQPKSLSEVEQKERTQKIAELNDRLRQSGEGGRIVITTGVQALEDDVRQRLFEAIGEFDAFDEDSDPYGEHDFGSVKIEGETYFFKVDYYDQNLEYASPDPADPEITNRVMTVLRADEY